MAVKGDLISVVEACYNLQVSDEQWLRAVATTFEALPFGGSLGTLAYHLREIEGGFAIESPIQAGGEHDVVARISRMGRALERKRAGLSSVSERAVVSVYESILNAAKEVHPDHMLLDEYRRFGPRWMYTLGVPKACDVLLLVNQHIDGLGTTVLARGMADHRTLSASERRAYQMLGAHIKAGFRLRHRFRSGSWPTQHAVDGAVLDGATNRLLDARGSAQSLVARRSIAETALAVDRARAQRSGRSDKALEVWQGLINGQWSLVEHFDSDGKRLILAQRNPEGVRDPRGLTNMETRVAGLAARGYSNKLIGYHLGVAEGTVSAHLNRACRKLRVSSRVELLKMAGSGFRSE